MRLRSRGAQQVASRRSASTLTSPTARSCAPRSAPSSAPRASTPSWRAGLTLDRVVDRSTTATSPCRWRSADERTADYCDGPRASPSRSPRRSAPRTRRSSRCPTSARRSGTAPTPPGSSRRSCSAARSPATTPFDAGYGYLFNSLLRGGRPAAPAARARADHPARASTRSARYREHVDDAMLDAARRATPTATALADARRARLHHEQQHQELLLMDIKHVLSCNPLRPAYGDARRWRRASAGAGGLDRRTTAASSRSATTATGSRSTTSGRATRCCSSRSRSPTGSSPAASGSRSWPTAATSGPSSGSPTAGRRCRRERLGRAAVLGRATATRGTVFTLAGMRAGRPDEPVVPRQLLRGRRLRPLGRRAGCRPRPSGRRSAATPSASRSTPRCTDGRRAVVRRRVAVDGAAPTCPTRASSPPPARSVSTTASSWSTSRCCAAARRSRPPGHARRTLPQLLPARRRAGRSRGSGSPGTTEQARALMLRTQQHRKDAHARSHRRHPHPAQDPAPRRRRRERAGEVGHHRPDGLRGRGLPGPPGLRRRRPRPTSTRSSTWTRWARSTTPRASREGTDWHPHRGFETVTYIIDGTFQHQDSHGGGGVITNGATQWMTAGGGILHIETPPEELVDQRRPVPRHPAVGQPAGRRTR